MLPTRPGAAITFALEDRRVRPVGVHTTDTETCVRVAIHSALAVCDDSAFVAWALHWLDGSDRSEQAAARAAAAAWAAAWAAARAAAARAAAAAWAAWDAAEAAAAAWDAAEAAAWAAQDAPVDLVEILALATTDERCSETH